MERYGNSGIVHSTQVQRAIDFAWRFFERSTKSVYQFGNNTIIRTEDKLQRDMLEGKIYELLMRDVLHNCGLDVTLDWDIYEGNDGGQDIVSVDGYVPALRFDIKGTKPSSRWFIIESHKVEKIRPDVFIMVQASIPPWLGKKGTKPVDIKGKFVGWIYRHNLFDTDGEPWFEYKHRDRLKNAAFVTEAKKHAEQVHGQVSKRDQIVQYYKLVAETSGMDLHINARLDANLNYGLPISWMINDIRRLCELLSLPVYRK